MPFINLVLAIPPSNHLPSLPSRFNHFKIRKVKGCKESRILLFETPLSLYQTCLSPLPNTSNVLTEQELPIFALLCFLKKLLSNIYYCVAAPRCGKERKKKTPPLTLCFGMNLSWQNCQQWLVENKIIKVWWCYLMRKRFDDAFQMCKAGKPATEETKVQSLSTQTQFRKWQQVSLCFCVCPCLCTVNFLNLGIWQNWPVRKITSFQSEFLAFFGFVFVLNLKPL